MKKVIFLSLVLLITISVVTNVYATTGFDISLKPSKNELNKGEEFIVDVQISNIKIDKGIIALGGILEFDKESLEIVKLEGGDKWSRPSYNEDNGKFATDRDDYATNDEIIFKITFKVKDESKENLTITLDDIAGSNGKDEIKLKNITTNITVKDGTLTPEPPTNTTIDNTTNITNNINTNTNTNINTSTNTNSDYKNSTNTNIIASTTNTNSNKNNTTNQNILTNTNLNTSENSIGGILPSAGTNLKLFEIVGILLIIACICYIRIRIIDSKATKNNIIK